MSSEGPAADEAWFGKASAKPAIDATGLGKRYEIYERPYQVVAYDPSRTPHVLPRVLGAVRRDAPHCAGRDRWSRRPQRLGQVHAAATGRGHTDANDRRRAHAGPDRRAARARQQLQSRIHRPRERPPERRDPGHLASRNAASVPAIEAFADIGDFIDQPIKTYSSGTITPLAFAVVVHVVPDVLIIDEAMGVGDTAFQSKRLARILEMQRSGPAIPLASHSLNTIIEFCDRAALDPGRLVAVGNSRDIVERYTNDLVSSYGGTTLPSAPETAPEAFQRSTKPLARAAPPRPPGPKPPAKIVSVLIVDEADVCMPYGKACVSKAAALIASCDVMVAMRLHAVLVGHLDGLHVLALERDDKVRVLGDELRIPAAHRMPLTENGERLPSALHRACGADGSPYHVDVSVGDELGRSACAHRDLLWQAMGMAARNDREAHSATQLLGRWIATDAQVTDRVTAELVRRREARMPRESV